MARPPGPPPLLPRPRFLGRVAAYWGFGLGGLGLSLALGRWGYHSIAALPWVDAFFDALIMSGIGPAAEMPNDPAKIFASLYGLSAGVAWTALLSVELYAFVHRMRPALHLPMRDGEDE